MLHPVKADTVISSSKDGTIVSSMIRETDNDSGVSEERCELLFQDSAAPIVSLDIENYSKNIVAAARLGTAWSIQRVLPQVSVYGRA